MALPDEAIATIRSLIQSGELKPGTRLPPEQQLAARLGLSRNSMREAVRALESARVLDVRRGDGTYVTSLAPALLLEGLGFAIDLLQDTSLLEVVEVRRMLEPVATGAAAARITDEALAELHGILDKMYATQDVSEQMVHYDILFHRTVIAANGNETLSSVIEALSSKTLRARVWRGVLDAGAATRTLAEHQAIYDALAARDAALAHSAALLHINTSESWLRKILKEKPTEQRGRVSNPIG
ncbi:MAG TPA: FCD domain-containing protein [Acidothermaceae bacterium]|jgi:GntR family transcriptional repressor for pyruvate dehydrogenase complex